ncbi:hypothetical protein D3C87_573830 [compost metagenome]
MKVSYKKEFEVELTRKIAVGSKFKISSSNGYCCPTGSIEVIEIGNRKDMNDESYDYESWTVEDQMPVNWVKFKYKIGEEVEILPLEIFAVHISTI